MPSNPSHAQAPQQSGQIEEIQNRRTARRAEIDISWGSFADEFRLPVRFEIAFRSHPTPAETGGSEARAQIAYQILRTVIVALDGIVCIFEVPIVDKCHHDSKAIERALVGKRVLAPSPFADLFCMAFKTNIVELSAGNKLLPSFQVHWQIGHVRFFEKIIFIGKVAHRPKQM